MLKFILVFNGLPSSLKFSPIYNFLGPRENSILTTLFETTNDYIAENGSLKKLGWVKMQQNKQGRLATCFKTCGTNCWCKNVFKKWKKLRLRHNLKGKLPTLSFFAFQGTVLGGGGGSQKHRSKFENPVIRPVFHR